MNVVEAFDIKKYYMAGTDVEVKALNGVNLEIREKEFGAIVGTSGSGKTTLLHIIGGLDTATSGIVLINDQDIMEMEEGERIRFRRRNVGFIFQSYNLVPILTGYENILLPLQLDNQKIDRDFIEDIMETLKITELCDRYPNQLSGGQQQRIAIARALASKPAIILGDEMTGNLDSVTTQQVLYLLRNTAEKYGQTIVMVTHNEEIANSCDHIIRIEDGKIVESRYQL